MNAMRSAGYSGSIGRYAAPLFSTPTNPTIISTDRGSDNPTMSSGPIPSAINEWASRFARRFSSA